MRLHLGPYEKYMNSTFAPEDTCLIKVREALKQDQLEGINVGAYEGKCLQFLIQVANVNKVVEIGTLYGYSTLWMARALKNDGQVISVDINEKHQARAKELLKEDPHYSKIRFVCGNAQQTLSSLESEGPFDMVFIDANKAGYLDYFNWARNNIRSGGLIVADNVFLFGTMFLDECPEGTPKKMWRVMKEMLTEAFKDQDLDSSLIPTEEGLLVCTKK